MRDLQPYEVLRAKLDEAITEFHATLNTLNQNVNHADGPMLLLFAINDLYTTHAAVIARIDAFTREYTYITEVNDEIRAQRDEINRKFESLKKTLNQLNLDDDSGGAKPNKNNRRKK